MYKKLFNYAILTGEVMLKSGAETSRVEDTINRILKTSGFETIESFVTPTGIFVTLDDPSIEMISFIKRVHKRNNYLNRLCLANDLSRKYCTGEINIDEAIKRIKIIETEPAYSNWILVLAKGVIAGGFTITFGGGFFDMLVAFVIGVLLGLTQDFLKKFQASRFFEDMIGGALIGLLAILFYYFLKIGSNFDLIIIGSIMPLVPGIAITNGIREIIQGDFVSGISRTADAFIVAASIAVGVGIVLKLFYVLGGVPL